MTLKKVVALVIWTCWALLSPVSSRQTFDREPEDRQVNPGEDLVMACRIRDKARDAECIWQKDGLPAGKYEWKRSGTDDCGIRINNANLEYDDGFWHCQVTPSAFNSDDALSSRPARLLVRIPPENPKIFMHGRVINEETELRIESHDNVRLRCESRGGNPPAQLRWFVDDDEIVEGVDFRNETDLENDKMHNAISVLIASFKREHNSKILKCRSYHEAYTGKVRETSSKLDVLYKPSVTLERQKSGLGDLEADVDTLEIECIADGNPRPNIAWRKAGKGSFAAFGSLLRLDPVRADDAGTYLCSARNEVGESGELSVTFDVLYEPKNIRTKPNGFVDLQAGSRAEFECVAEGNPEPDFEWIQRITDTEMKLEKSRSLTRSFKFRNVSYEDEGLWICVASNRIKGKERRFESQSIRVDVSGLPEVLDFNAASVQPFARHSTANIDVVFCADPKPRNTYWEWDTSRLDQEESRGRFTAKKIKQHRLSDCYLATLVVKDVLPSDSGLYYLVTSNDRGELTFGVQLEVVDPIAMTTVIGISAAGLIIIIMIAITIVVYCRSGKRGLKCSKSKKVSESNTFFPYYPRSTKQTMSRQTTTSNPPPGAFEDSLENVHYAPTEVLPSQHKFQVVTIPPQDYDTSTFRSPLPEEPDLIYRAVPKREPSYPLPPTSQFPLQGDQE